MLYFTWSSNCSGDELNESLGQHDRPYVQQEMLLMFWVMPISLAAGLVNTFSFVVFLNQVFDNKAVQFNLLAISCSEILIQAAICMEGCIVLSSYEHQHTLTSYGVTTIVHIYVNSCFCLRNWNLALLTLSRCEVVFKPFSARHSLFFSKRKLICGQLVFASVSIALSVTYNLGNQGLVCTNFQGIVINRSLLQTYVFYQYFEMYGLFMFQACLPIITIFIATFLLVIKLRQYPNLVKTFSTVSSPQHVKKFIPKSPALNKIRSTSVITCNSNRPSIPRQEDPSQLIVLDLVSDKPYNSPRCFNYRHSERSRSVTDNLSVVKPSRSVGSLQFGAFTIHGSSSALYPRATILVLVLSVVFCLFQLPTFITTCVLLFAPDITFTIHPDVFTNTLNIIGSLVNFFVYAASSTGFRTVALEILFRKKVRRHSSTALIYTSALQSNR